jgi:hypothetical protein
MGEVKNIYELLVGKPQEERPFGKHQSRWRNIFNDILKR